MSGINDIRKANALLLINERFEGGMNRLATAIGRHPSQVSRWFMDNKHKRLMGEKLARDIERILGLPDGWLDVEQEGAPIIRPSNRSAEFVVIVRLLDGLTLGEKIELMGVLARSASGEEPE